MYAEEVSIYRADGDSLITKMRSYSKLQTQWPWFAECEYIEIANFILLTSRKATPTPRNIFNHLASLC
jgi:hypothetical protein